MRVAIDAHMVGTQETGNETYIKYLIQAMQSMDLSGIDVDILQTADSQSPLNPTLPDKGFRVLQVTPTHSIGRLAWGIPRTVRQERDQVLHMTYNVPFWSRSSAQVVSVHDLAYKLYPRYYSPRVRLLLSILVPLSIRRAERVIVISEQTKQDLIREYRVSPAKIVLTPLAAAPEFQVQKTRIGQQRVLAHYGIQAPFILAVGNLEPRKNLTRIIRAFGTLLRQSLPSHQLVIVGKAHWQGSTVGQEIKRLGLTNKVILTDYVPTDDLVSLYNAAQLFCYPSLYEGFGLPILEAMSCGTPVIASNVSSIPEVAGMAAWLVDPLSEQELTAAMERILTDETLRYELREKGLQRAASFSWAKTAKRTLQAYQEAWTAYCQNRRGTRV